MTSTELAILQQRLEVAAREFQILADDLRQIAATARGRARRTHLLAMAAKCERLAEFFAVATHDPDHEQAGLLARLAKRTLALFLAGSVFAAGGVVTGGLEELGSDAVDHLFRALNSAERAADGVVPEWDNRMEPGRSADEDRASPCAEVGLEGFNIEEAYRRTSEFDARSSDGLTRLLVRQAHVAGRDEEAELLIALGHAADIADLGFFREGQVLADELRLRLPAPLEAANAKQLWQQYLETFLQQAVDDTERFLGDSFETSGEGAVPES